MRRTLHCNHLEKLVTERTNELRKINNQLSLEVAERKRIEERLQKYRVLAENTRDIILFISYDGKIVEANNAAINAYGYTREEICSLRINDLSMSGMVDKHIKKAFAEGVLFETMHCRKDGSKFFVEINSQSAQLGDERVLISVIRDITKRKQIEDELHYLATHDSLTNVLNRYSLEQSLKRVVQKTKRTGKKSALLMIDVDNFKFVNDAYGHAAGDNLLVSMVDLLQDHIRDNDMLARVGGDEFAVLLEGADTDEAKRVAENLRRVLNETELDIKTHGCQIGLTTSIGIAIIDGTLSYEKIVSYADVALYEAKEEGKNRIVLLYSEADKKRISEEARMASLIRAAIDEKRFVLHFQPVVKIGEGITHYEALLRMHDENGLLIYPDKIITVAEKIGFISQIDKWVFDEVIYLLRNFPGRIFINLSGVSLGDKELLKHIEKTIKEQALDPSHLGFEITETTAVKDIIQAKRWISKLKSLGCKFALDDFGVGFSSFSHLQMLPVDFLKIDGSFVKNLESSSDQTALVRAMNEVAHSLGKETIAEFVENEAVLEILKHLQIDYGQGYYWGRPTPIIGCE